MVINRTDVSGKVFAGLHNFDNVRALYDKLPKVIGLLVEEYNYSSNFFRIQLLITLTLHLLKFILVRNSNSMLIFFLLSHSTFPFPGIEFDYSGMLLFHKDLALIQLPNGFTLSASIQPLCLHRNFRMYEQSLSRTD